MRGKGDEMTDDTKTIGIIPACAGKSELCGGVFGRAGDHPRVCGEKRVGGFP